MSPGHSPELLAVRLNGVPQPQSVIVLRLSQGGIAVPVEALREWGFRDSPEAALTVESQVFQLLDKMDGVRWSVDGATQTLSIAAPASAFSRNEFLPSAGDEPLRVPSSLGGYLNYDAQWQRLGSAPGGAAMEQRSALLEAGAFNVAGHGATSGIWRDGSGLGAGAAQSRFTRLDSTWNMDWPLRTASLRLGDAITQAGGWGRSVRFGGVQWATNFATRPGLVRFPLPAVRGEAAVPSAVDLYVNNALLLRGQVPSGAFDLPQVPVVTGQGQIKMVVRDMLGREQVIVQPYYVSAALLKPGLRDFSLEAGWVREDYGLRSGNYGRAVVSATDRLGVTPAFTRELRAEVLARQQAAGAGGTWLLGRAATFTAAGALSRSPGGSGALAQLALERQARDWGANAQLKWSSRGFAQMGQNPLALPELAQSPRLSVGGGFSVSLGRTGLSFFGQRQTNWQGPGDTLLSASLGHDLGAAGFISLFASRSSGVAGATHVGIQWTHTLDERTTASAGAYRSRQRPVPVPPPGAPAVQALSATQATAQVGTALPEGTGWAYQLRADEGSQRRSAAELRWRLPQVDLGAQVARYDGVQSYQAGVSGGVAVMPEGVFLSRRVDGSFAVVKVGDYPGVRVQRESQEVARTDARGLAFVPGLRGYEANRLSVAPSDLPMDAAVDGLALSIAPPTRSGVSVSFAVRRQRSVALRLLGPTGQPVPPGSWVSVAGQGRQYPVGFGGRLFLVDVGKQARLTAQWPGMRCAARIEIPDDVEEVPDLGYWPCTPQP